MKRDVRPYLRVFCEFCEDESANCHTLDDVRWSLVDHDSSAKPVPICQNCHDDSDAAVILEWEYLAPIKISEPKFEKLRECCGYVENGTPQTVCIGQDDATQSWSLTIGKHPAKKSYIGRSLEEVVEEAYLIERQFDDDGNLL